MTKMEGMKDDIKTGVYKHYKGGLYCVIGLSTHSESLEPMVIYYHYNEPDKLWVGPASMWNNLVNGTPRFSFVSDEPIETMVSRCFKNIT